MEAQKTEPQIHVRIAHVHTLKDGWRLAETTVSYDGPVTDLPGMHGTMAAEMKMANDLGQAEAHARNNPELYGEVAS